MLNNVESNTCRAGIEILLPRAGIALHGTTTARLAKIEQEGLDRRRHDPNDLPGIDFCIVHRKLSGPDRTIPQQWEEALSRCWGFADRAVEKDEAIGVVSYPVVIILKPPSKYSLVYGGPKAYTQNPISRRDILGALRSDDDPMEGLGKYLAGFKKKHIFNSAPFCH